MNDLEWLNYYKEILKKSNITYRPNGFEIIEKRLMAFEIWRNKPYIDCQMIRHFDNVEELNKYIEFMYGYRCQSVLTQEEYDLLKETLQ